MFWCLQINQCRERWLSMDDFSGKRISGSDLLEMRLGDDVLICNSRIESPVCGVYSSRNENTNAGLRFLGFSYDENSKGRQH